MSVQLPEWAVVTSERRAHIERVVALMAAWAMALPVQASEAVDWHDAARWHDALRDAPEEQLRALVPDHDGDVALLHGPAAAARLEQEGEARRHVLDAIRFHTVGSATWDRTGRALYMADFLEPGRPWDRADRAFLARQVPTDFDGVFRQVVRRRIERVLRDGTALRRETAELWNRVR